MPCSFTLAGFDLQDLLLAFPTIQQILHRYYLDSDNIFQSEIAFSFFFLQKLNN